MSNEDIKLKKIIYGVRHVSSKASHASTGVGVGMGAAGWLVGTGIGSAVVIALIAKACVGKPQHEFVVFEYGKELQNSIDGYVNWCDVIYNMCS